MELQEEFVSSKIKSVLSSYVRDVIPKFIEAAHSTCVTLHTLADVTRDPISVSMGSNTTLPFVLESHDEMIPLRIRIREYWKHAGVGTVTVYGHVEKSLQQVFDEDSAPSRFGDVINMVKKLTIGSSRNKFEVELSGEMTASEEEEEEEGNSTEVHWIPVEGEDCAFEVENVTSLFLKNFALLDMSMLHGYTLDLPESLNAQLREATNPSSVGGTGQLPPSSAEDKRRWVFLPKDHVLCYYLYLHSKDGGSNGQEAVLAKHEHGFFLENQELQLLTSMFEENVYIPMIKRYVRWVAPNAVKLHTRCEDVASTALDDAVRLKITFTYIAHSELKGNELLNNKNVLPTLDPLLIEQLRQGDFLRN